MSDYDVIVIGGGSPGEHCAGALAEGGLRVAVVERELVGGECSYWACIPSKTLLRPGEAVHAARDARRNARGRRRGGVRLAGLHGLRTIPTPGRRGGWPTHGIDLLRGSGRLAGPGEVEVDGARHTAEHVVLANGSDPVVPPIPGLRELDGVWTSREATGMKAVPRRLLVLGGGPVGVEMAQAVRRLGGEVVVVGAPAHRAAREPAPLGRGARRGAAPRRRRARASARSATRGTSRRRGLRAGARRRPRAARGPAARGHGSPAARRGAGPGDGRASSRRHAASRSTRGCALATGSGRSAMSPASGR